jgi:hypothetical protein
VVDLFSRLAIAGIFVGMSSLLFGKDAAFDVEAWMKLSRPRRIPGALLDAVVLPVWSAWRRDLQ